MKTLWQIIKGTLIGEDGEGSAKRAASFYFTLVLLTSMIFVEEYCYYLATLSASPTTAQMVVIKSHEPIMFSILLTLWIFFGFTSFDKIVDAFKWFKGVKSQEGKTE